jgi:hypothetical protein
VIVSIACIVEGDGEVQAVPLLIRRIAAEAFPELQINVISPPIRVSRDKLMKAAELERAVELAARQVGPAGAISVLIDSDDDCPAIVAADLRRRARAARGDFPISVVLAKREFEAWFLAAAVSLRGRRGLRTDLAPPRVPEEIRDAKGWLRDQMPAGRKYRETLDQPALAAVFDLTAARSSGSFDKYYRDVIGLIKECRDRATVH